MLYEQYARKIRRYADIRDAVLRFKIPIICVLAAIIAAISGFLITKGIITEQISGTEEYTYGEGFSFDAGALFSDITLEYSSDGGESWSETEPAMPGEYLVRAVSNKSFGGKGYSEPYAFAISPRSATLDISDSSVEWRVQPAVKANGLAGADKLAFVSVRMSADTVGSIDATADTGSAVILNAEGEDVTAAYSLTAQTRTVTVTPRYVTLKANDVSKVYDGNNAEPTGYSVASGSIADGHVADVSFKQYTCVNANTEAKITIKDVKIAENGTDVTGNYKITLLDGTASVTKRPITVSSPGAVKQFDGLALELPGYSITAGSVASGDELVVDTYNYDDDDTLFNAMETGVEFIQRVTVRNIFDTDVDKTENYDITVDPGILLITKRSITVTTDSAQKIYDGTALTTGGTYTLVGTLAEGHEFIVDEKSIISLTTPDSVENGISYSIMFNGLNLTGCYDITNEFGMLTVTPRKLTISTGDREEIYNGGEWQKTGFENTLDDGNGAGLMSGHRIVDYEYSSITNVGSIPNELLDYDILDENGNSVKAYYDVDPQWGTLTVNKSAVTVTSGSSDPDNPHVFDGYAETNDTATGVGLVDGHWIYVMSWVDDHIAAGTVDNVITVEIRDLTGNRVTDNYDITYVYGTLTVEKRVIEVRFTDIERYYDGMNVSFSYYREIEGYTVQANGIYHTFSVDMDKNYCNVADSGTYTVKYSIGGKDVDKWIDCYDVRLIYVDSDGNETERDYATITIKKLPVTIYVNDISKIYDGTFAGVSWDEVATYAYGESLSIAMLEQYIDASDTPYKYTVEYKITDASGKITTDNYDVKVIYTDEVNGYSLCTIEYRKINVTNQNYNTSYEYDGTARWAHTIEASSGHDPILDTALASGHRIEYISYPRLTNVGIEKNVIVYDIVNEDGVSVKHNYDISEDWGTLEITPRKIIVVTNDHVKEYDGEVLEDRHVTVLWATLENVNGLVSDLHEIKLDETVKTQIGPNVLRDEDRNVTGKLNELLVADILYSHDGTVDSVFGNYEIVEYRYGTLLILPREIYVTTGSDNMEYNGDTLTNSYYTVDGLLTGHKLNPAALKFTGSRLRVGMSENTAETVEDVYTVYDSRLGLSDENYNMSDNYNINFVFGTLEVTPIQITVQPSYVKATYNGSAYTVTSGRCTTKNKLLSGDAVLYVSAEGSQTEAGTGTSRIVTAVVRDAYGIGVYTDGGMTYYEFINAANPMYVPVSEGTLIIYPDGSVERTTGSRRSNCTVVEEYGCSYSLNCLENEIIVTRRKIVISAPTITGYYEGMTLPESRISQGEMVDGHYLFISTQVTEKNDELVSTVDEAKIQIYGDENFKSKLDDSVKNNYEFVIKDGAVS